MTKQRKRYLLSMVQAQKLGQMGRHMLGNGGMALHMERAFFIMRMEIIMKGNSFKIKLTVMANTAIKMDRLILGTGRMICSLDLVERN